MRKLILTLALVVAVHSLAWGGMLIEGRTGDGKPFVWACEDGLFRFGSDENYTIIDTRTQMTYVVMPQEKAYLAFSAEENRRRMEEMQAQLEKMRKSLGAMGQKLGGLFGKSAKEEKPRQPQMNFKKTGQRDRIAGYTVEKVVVYQDGRPVRELWVSSKVAKDMAHRCDLESLARMAEASFPAQNGEEATFSAYQIKNYQSLGYPLKEVSYRDGTRMEITKIEKKTLPKNYFKVPAGFQQKTYPGVGQGGMPW